MSGRGGRNQLSFDKVIIVICHRIWAENPEGYRIASSIALKGLKVSLIDESGQSSDSTKTGHCAQLSECELSDR